MATPGPAIGETIGPYRVLSQLGQGGMGVVYLAEDTRLGRKVALKALARDYAGDPVRRKRFLNEARAAAALSHPAVAAVYELEERGEDIFIIFEYVEGQNLREKIGATPLPQLLEIAVQIAGAMEAAHAKGIVHRDLKPENVMVRPDGEVKVLDFGLARFDSGVLGGATETQSFGLTQAGTVMGTVGYMSPEQLEGKPTDFRSDLFSYGVMLYELATSTHPFAGDTPASTIANVMTQEPPPLTSANALHPPELERIVKKCLRKSRDDRYQSTRDLLVDLKQLKRDSDEHPTATMRAAPTPSASSAPGTVAVAPLGQTLLRTRIAIGLVMAPANIAFAWVMKDWMVQPLGTGLFFIIVICMAAAIGLRVLLLSFMAWRPEELAHVVGLSAPWAALANVATATVLLVMAAQTYSHHLGFAAFITFIAIGSLFVTLVVEPMMLRRAFPGLDPTQMGGGPDANCASLQLLFAFLLASPLVDFALSSKSLTDYLSPLAPGAARWLALGVALIAYCGGVSALVWAGDAWRGGPIAARTFRRWFPLFLLADLAASAVWTTWLALVHPPPRPLYFLLLFLVWLPFHQLKLARAVPGSDIQEPAVPTDPLRSKARTLAVMQGLLAAPFPLMLFMAAHLLTDATMQAGMRDSGGMPAWAVRALPPALMTIAVLALLVSGGKMLAFLRQPEDAARQFQRFFAGFVVLGGLSGWMWAMSLIALSGLLFSNTPEFLPPLLGPLLPVGGALLVFYQRRLARELAPPEPVPASAFRSPQAWWMAHQLSNLLFLAPWVAYWGWLTRGYFGAFSRIVFLFLGLAVAARWSLHFVLVCTWLWNRTALSAAWQRLVLPLRYVGFAIVGVMLVQAGMAAAKDDVGFAALIGGLAMGGLASVLLIEPAIAPPVRQP